MDNLIYRWSGSLIVLLILGIIWGACSFANYSCGKTATKMGMHYEWAWETGCMIEPHQGRWVPLRNYRGL